MTAEALAAMPVVALAVRARAVALVAVHPMPGVGVTEQIASHAALCLPVWAMRLFVLSAMRWSTPRLRCASLLRRRMARC